MIDIKYFTNEGGQGGRPGEGGIYFFDIFLYYFINVIIKTLYISSFCCLRYIFYTLFILMCFSLLLKS